MEAIRNLISCSTLVSKLDPGAATTCGRLMTSVRGASKTTPIRRTEKQRVAIYRTVYPLASEAFIPCQVSALTRFVPVVWARDVVAVLRGDQLVQSLAPGARWLTRPVFTMIGWMKPSVWRRDPPALLHAHFGPDAAVLLPFAMRQRIPLIVTFHGFDAQQSRRCLLRSMRLSNILFLMREQKLYHYASRVLVVSKYLKSRLVQNGCPVEKIIVHYIGVDTTKYIPDEARRVPFRLVNVSRHVPWKGIDTILRALPRVLAEFPDAELLQIGSGPETEALKALAKKLGVWDKVKMLGAQPNDRVLKEIQSASLYVQGSRLDDAGQTEAFGIALLEAQACGIPVIATNSGGIPEAMIDGETGLLFAENDHEALSHNIVRLFARTDKLRSMGRRARSMVVDRFDLRAQTAVLEQIYDQVLERPCD